MRWVVTLLVVALLSGCTRPSDRPQIEAPAEASERERVRRELEAVFAKRVQATKDKDAEALIALTSPDYSATLPSGEKLNYEQIKNYLRRGTEQFVFGCRSGDHHRDSNG